MRNLIVVMTALSLLLALNACGKQEPVPTVAETTSVAAQAENAIFEGVLEDKKDFMITVSDDQGNAYVFNLDGVTVDADPGQRVMVTYTGDLSDFDAVLTAVKVEKL